jgi:flagellin
MASFSVVTNIAASNATANLEATNIGLNKTITRLSSGLRINSSGDDAAGLAVANQFRSTEAVLTQGVQNANDGLSALQIKDGALGNISTLLDRLSTLATESASSASTASRTVLNNEFQDVLSEIDREANVAGLTTSGGFSVGAANVSALSLTGQKVDTAANAATAVAAIATAISNLGSTQGSVGQIENRLSYAISLSQTQIVNDQAAESRLRDANIAQESANLTKFQILTQSGLSALAQANSTSGAVLKLLQ